MPESSYGRFIKWLIVIMVTPEEFGTDCETVRLALEAENIESRPVWKPMHLQPVFRVAAKSQKVKAQSSRKKAYEASQTLFSIPPPLPSIVNRFRGKLQFHLKQNRTPTKEIGGTIYEDKK